MLVECRRAGTSGRSSASCSAGQGEGVATGTGCRSRRVDRSLAVLLALTFSKFLYHACLTSYYTFFLIHKFGVSVQASQIYLFVFLAAVAVGTFVGGPLGDRFGRKLVIWFSILGVLPFSLAAALRQPLLDRRAVGRRSA